MSDSEVKAELKTEKVVIEETEKVTYKMSVGYVGNIEQFSFTENDLEEYLDRVEQSFLVNKIEDELKVPFLISTAAKEFNEKVKILLKPKLIKDFKYVDLKKILLDHFRPTKNVRAERFKFWSRQIQENESLTEFILELRNLSSTCEYGSFLDQMLSDKLILSLKDAHMQKKLMDEPTDIPFSKICNSALAMEMIKNEVNDIQHHATHVNKVAYKINTQNENYHNMQRDFSEQKETLEADWDQRDSLNTTIILVSILVQIITCINRTNLFSITSVSNVSSAVICKEIAPNIKTKLKEENVSLE